MWGAGHRSLNFLGVRTPISTLVTGGSRVQGAMLPRRPTNFLFCKKTDFRTNWPTSPVALGAPLASDHELCPCTPLGLGLYPVSRYRFALRAHCTPNSGPGSASTHECHHTHRGCATAAGVCDVPSTKIDQFNNVQHSKSDRYARKTQAC